MMAGSPPPPSWERARAALLADPGGGYAENSRGPPGGRPGGLSVYHSEPGLCGAFARARKGAH